MVRAAGIVLTIAVVLGLGAVAGFMRGKRWPWFGMLHGIVAASGLALLLLALRGPRRGDAMGVGAFGAAAAVLFAVALTFGLMLPRVIRRSESVGGFVIAVHATVAITAYVLFLAWASNG